MTNYSGNYLFNKSIMPVSIKCYHIIVGYITNSKTYFVVLTDNSFGIVLITVSGVLLSQYDNLFSNIYFIGVLMNITFKATSLCD